MAFLGPAGVKITLFPIPDFHEKLASAPERGV
jgi:hypothetical protein